MNKVVLEKLKSLKIERKDGPLFRSSHECMDWIDHVLPLLKFDESYYEDFREHSEYVRITSLSPDTLMPHLNAMIGIVNQAIAELQNEAESEPDPETVFGVIAKTGDNKNPDAHAWYQRPIGLSGVGILIAIISALAIYLIKSYLGIAL